MARILIVENDPHLKGELRQLLLAEGLQVEEASSCTEAWEIIRREELNLILLETQLPDGCGLQLCSKIRDNSFEVPVIFLSSKTDEATAVKAMKSGGDDYLRRPIGLEELKVRIQKYLRQNSAPSGVIRFGFLTIDPVKRAAIIRDKAVALGRKELDILALLARRAGGIVTRENILSALYGDAELYDRTVDSHMSHLRRKLRSAAGSSLQIISVYGLGYKLEWKTA